MKVVAQVGRLYHEEKVLGRRLETPEVLNALLEPGMVKAEASDRKGDSQGIDECMQGQKRKLM